MRFSAEFITRFMKFTLRFVRWHHAPAVEEVVSEASREGGEASMDFNEKVLYHQIHPAKLAADVGGSLLSTYLMRRRRFAWAMLAAFVPALLASVLVIRYADLERRKHSPFGRYIHRYMDWRVSGLRSFGQVVIWVGAWQRVGKLVPIGWAIVVGAWASGLWRKPTN
jgi:hypothetical protein